MSPPSRLAIAALALSLSAASAQPQAFRKTFTVAPSQPVELEIALSSGDVQVSYSHDGEVSIVASGQAPDGSPLGANYLGSIFAVEQRGNHIGLHNVAAVKSTRKISYRIDVPYRTEVASKVDHGLQTFTGIMGPVKAEGGDGDIKAAYVSLGMQARTGAGNLQFDVIGDHVTARTESGNISATRIERGVDAETGDGDISLIVIGNSKATVTQGTGRVEVEAVKGRFSGSTQAGDIHVKAEAHGDWNLRSASGTIRVKLPPAQKADLEAHTASGSLLVEREDLDPPLTEPRHLAQKLHGGGPRIEIYSEAGKILIR